MDHSGDFLRLGNAGQGDGLMFHSQLWLPFGCVGHGSVDRGRTYNIDSYTLVTQFDDYGNYVEVFLKKGADSNQLLKKLLEKLEIQRFECTSSSLNDIFIETVGRDQDV